MPYLCAWHLNNFLTCLSHADLVTATKSDVETHFGSHGTGKISEIKLMNGFGFIEYEDSMDARDVVPGKTCLPENIR